LTASLYGFRAKIGLVIPSNNTVIEPELWAMCPPEVTVHGNRILARGPSSEGIVEMEKSAGRAIEELKAGQMSVIIYACLATSLVKGPTWTREVARRIEVDTGCPGTTAATATFEALQALGTRRVAIATPYPDNIQSLLPAFVADFGLELVATRNLGIQNSLALWKIPGEQVRAFARSVDVPEAQALCIVATDLPTVGEIAALEAELGKPVVTTNQAILWKALALADIDDSVVGFGTLLSKQPKALT
jgi:maleate cis-trans isomerase